MMSGTRNQLVDSTFRVLVSVDANRKKLWLMVYNNCQMLVGNLNVCALLKLVSTERLLSML